MDARVRADASGMVEHRPSHVRHGGGEIVALAVVLAYCCVLLHELLLLRFGQPALLMVDVRQLQQGFLVQIVRGLLRGSGLVVLQQLANLGEVGGQPRVRHVLDEVARGVAHTARQPTLLELGQYRLQRRDLLLGPLDCFDLGGQTTKLLVQLGNAVLQSGVRVGVPLGVLHQHVDAGLQRLDVALAGSLGGSQLVAQLE